MITTSQMYWITSLDAIVKMLSVFVLLLGLIMFGLVAGGCMLRNDYSTTERGYATGRRLHKAALRLIAPFLFLVFAFTFTPTTKQMAAILVVPRIANSEKVQIVGNKLYDLAVEWMDELRPNKNKNKEGTNK